MSVTEKQTKNSDECLALTVKDFCRKFNISRSTLYKYEKNGSIRLIRAFGKTLVPTDEVRRLLGGAA